jgi:hypothetical protein
VSDSRIRGIYYPPEKKEEKRDSPCSLPIKDQERRRDSNMRNSER